jgi:polyisoprenoid-binding protein YceI
MPLAPTTPSPSLWRPLVAGLAAGSIAAAAASLVSLPLRSPDDVFFNTASVTIGSLLAGAAAGGAWWAVRRRGWSVPAFLLCLAAAFVLVAGSALAMDALPGAPLERVAAFVVPLAAIVLGLLALLTPAFARPALRATWVAPAGTAAALVLGIALAGQGDAESGRLALPAASSSSSTGQAADRTSPSGVVLRPADLAGITFTVATGESTATYTVREKLTELPLPSDAVGRTSAISGTIFLDGRPSKLTVDLRTLQSNQPRRDNFIRSQGGPVFNRYPFAEFTVTDLTGLPEEYRQGETVTSQVTGMMKIREVERPLTFSIEARLEGGVLQVLGRTDFTWADFQIPPPNVAGIVKVEDNVHLEVLIVAKQSERG